MPGHGPAYLPFSVRRERELLCRTVLRPDGQCGGDRVVGQAERPSVSQRSFPEECELDHEAWPPVTETCD